jgi:hypothetical protein
MANLEWVRGDSAFNMRGAYLTDEAACPVCKCPNHFEFIESFSSPAKCIVGCVHLRERDFREDGNNWYGFES